MSSEIKSIGIVGLGYVGLPTAIAFYNANFHVSESPMFLQRSSIC